MPDMSYYDPDGMSLKKKAEFERWYAEKVAANYHFVTRREMEAYCESDVKLLKAGCQKFRNEFKQKADFDPMEKCVTIASACNRFWRKKTSTNSQDCLGTASWMARFTIQPVHQGPQMVSLASTPTAPTISCYRRTFPLHSKRG